MPARPPYLSALTWTLLCARFETWTVLNPADPRYPAAEDARRRKALRDIFLDTLTPDDVKIHLFGVVAELFMGGAQVVKADLWSEVEAGTIADMPVRDLFLDLDRRLRRLEDGE